MNVTWSKIKCSKIRDGGWPPAAILKIIISPYLSEKSSVFDEIVYTAADIELDERYVINYEQEAQLSLTNREMLVCTVVEVWQDFLSEYVDKKFTYIRYKRINLIWQQKLCNLQQLKIAVFTYRGPHLCFPWRRRCDYHALCCTDGKTIQWFSNPSLHVPICFQ